MGAGQIVAAGRNAEALEMIARAGGTLVTPVRLSGDVAADSKKLRSAAGGGAHLAFDMVGNARDPSSTLAAVGALARDGRLVLMGSSSVPLPINYLQVMFNNLEIIGNFMHAPDAYLPLLTLVRSSRLALDKIVPRSFVLSNLVLAMEAAATAHCLEMVVVTSKVGD
jgi:alcohol dehydrogenase